MQGPLFSVFRAHPIYKKMKFEDSVFRPHPIYKKMKFEVSVFRPHPIYKKMKFEVSVFFQVDICCFPDGLF